MSARTAFRSLALTLGGALVIAIPLTAGAPGESPLAWRATPIKFARHPHIANGMIAFSYHGDIWLANEDGSNPRILTTHVARESSPRFSPDGRMIAFTSNRMGNDDVFIVPITGGEPTQLTWHTGNDTVLYWTPDGKGVVVTSSRAVHPFLNPLYVVPIDGSVPTPLPMDVGRSGMIRQDGSLIAFNRLGGSYWRKGYQGNNSGDIWVQDLRSKEIRQLTDTVVQNFREHRHDDHPMWGADGQIYFLSERSGIFNIWKIDPRGGQPQQVTRHTTDGVQFPSISPDGRKLIYENEFDLWTVDLPSGQPKRLTLALPVDPRDNLVEWVETDNRADGFSVAPGADYLAVDFRGEIMIVPTDPTVGEKRQVTASPWRERFQEYSPDGRFLAYVSDESGEEEIWLHTLASGEKKKLTTHESTKSGVTWAPSSQKLAFVAANRLFEVEVPSGRTTELGYNQAGGYQIGEYSADGNWLLFSRSDPDQNRDVFLFDVRARREQNISQSPFTDGNPLLTPDGRTVVFTSNRDGGTTHLFAVSLQRLTEDPNDPVVRERLRRERPDSGESRGAGEGGQNRQGAGAGGNAPQARAIQIDLPGIEKRARQLTSGENGVGSTFLSRDGRTVYFTSSDNDGPGLFQIGIDGRDRRKTAPGSFPGLTPTADRRAVFYRVGGGGGQGGGGGGGGGAQGQEIHRMTLQNQRKERINFAFSVKVETKADWEQIFEESWRVMKYRFYDEKMHGRDWAAIKRTYRPILPHVGTYEDLYDLTNEMIGELNASHTGVSGPPSRPQERGYTTRFLGFEIEPQAEGGRYRISHIYRDGPADQEWLGLSVGDYVLSIDGQELKAPQNYWQILGQTINEYVPVRVAKSAGGEGARTVRIRSVTSLNNIKYEEWVAKNREFVEKESGGRIAYVHIRSMNQPSLERFQTEIDQLWNKQGIVVDIRYNGGGNIDQQLIDILERRPYQFWNSRWGAPTWGRRPRQAIAGPKVMLINHRSGSDSEVTPMGFRDLGLGRIVGHPTAAAVIATGSYSLIHGGSIRTPGSLVVQWDPTKPNNFGINLENYGVAPDVWVKNTPADELRGHDRELKAAVDEALRMLREGKWQYTTDQERN